MVSRMTGKNYKKILLCSVAFSLVATPALADPVSIGTLVVSGINALLAAGGTGLAISGTTAIIGGITVAGIIGSTVLAAGSIGLQLLLGSGKKPGQQQSIDPGNARQSFATGNSGQWRAIGRAKIGGVIAFGNTSGFDRYRLIARCKGPIDAIESTFIGNREVTLEPNGDVSSPPYARPGGSWVNIKKKIGDGTEVAWPELVSSFPTMWTNDHKLRGVNQTLVKYTSPGVQNPLYLRLFGSGYGDVSEIGRWELLYDPRIDARRWTDNGIVAVLHILLDQFGFPLEWFDIPHLIDQANLADTLVPIRDGGTEKRSRAWGTWEEDSIPRGDLLSQILISTGIEVVFRPDNKIGLALIDDNRTSEVAFGVRQILSMMLKTGPEGVERPNVCKVRYYSPERDYEMAEIPLVYDTTASPNVPLPWSIYQDEIDRVGRKEAKYELPFCPSASQAQRIARRLFALQRAETAIIKTNLSGIGVWGARCVTFEDPDFGNLKVMPNPPRIDDEIRTVEVGCVVLPELTPYNPVTDEAFPPAEIPDLGFVADIPAPVIPTSLTVVEYPVANTIVTRLGYVAPEPSVTTIEANYRVGGVTPGPWLAMTERKHPVGSPTSYHAYVPMDLSGDTIEARIRYFNAAEDASAWSPVLSFVPMTVTSPPTIPSMMMEQYIEFETQKLRFTINAPGSLNVAAIQKSGSWSGFVDCEPGEVITIEIDKPASVSLETTYTWTISAIATGGAASETASISLTIPAL